MDTRLIDEKDAIGWLDAISHLPKDEDTFPFFQALDEIKATIQFAVSGSLINSRI